MEVCRCALGNVRLPLNPPQIQPLVCPLSLRDIPTDGNWHRNCKSSFESSWSVQSRDEPFSPCSGRCKAARVLCLPLNTSIFRGIQILDEISTTWQGQNHFWSHPTVLTRIRNLWSERGICSFDSFGSFTCQQDRVNAYYGNAIKRTAAARTKLRLIKRHRSRSRSSQHLFASRNDK